MEQKEIGGATECSAIISEHLISYIFLHFFQERGRVQAEKGFARRERSSGFVALQS